MVELARGTGSTEDGATDAAAVSGWTPWNRGRIWGPVTMAGLVLAAVIPYLNTLPNGFIYDDHFQILTNPYLRSFHYVRAIFTTSVWSYLGGARGLTNYYRPLMTFGYLLCFQLFGASAFAFHLVNLALNAAVVLLVYAVSVQLFGDRRLALVAALVFALHPVHTESVDWIAAVTDLELTLFYLAAFWFYLRIPQLSNARPSAPWVRTQAGVVVFLALAMLSKEQALTLPVLCMAFEHLYREDRARTTTKEKMARYAGAWLLVPVYLLLRAHFLGGLAPARPARPGISVEEVALSILALLGQYAGKMLWPVRLCAYWVFPVTWPVLLPKVLAGALTVLLGTLIFVALWRRSRLVSFGLVWFVVTLLPVLNLRWMPIAAFAERYLYLPSVGGCWVIAWAGVRLWNLARIRGRAWRLALGSAGALLAALAVARTVTRNRDWHDDITFYQRTLEASPDAYVIHTDLGKVYWDAGQNRLAEQEWRAAARIEPDEPVVLSNLGVLLTAQGHYDEAVVDLRRGLAAVPDDTGAHIDLGMAYERMGRQDDAESEFRAAMRLSPLNVFARNQLGQLYFDEGRFAEADVQFRASLELEPNLSGWFGLGLSRWRQGDLAEAERDFKNAQALDAADSRVHFMLALLYGFARRYPEALAEYQQGFRINPDNPQALAAFHKLQSEISNANSSRAAPETH